MQQFRFLDWKVYRDAQVLFIQVSEIFSCLPQSLQYTLGSQLSRASLSVVLNIAEGSGKYSDKETSRFLEIALGSLYESYAALDTLLKMNHFSKEKMSELDTQMKEIASQIGGLKKKIPA